MAGGAVLAGPEVKLSDVEAVLGRWCDQVDVSTLTGAQAAAAAERLAVINRRGIAKQAELAARAAECNAYSSRACSAEEWQARQTGTSRSEAKRALETARRMKSCPVAAEAFANGELSLAEANLVTEAAVLNPAAEAKLVAKATSTHDLGAVRDATDKVKRAARSAEDEAARVARLRAGRHWREFTDADGHRCVDAKFVPEDFASVAPIIDAFTDAEFEAGRRAGTRDSHEARRSDGVLAALRAAGELIGLTSSSTTESAECEAAVSTVAGLKVPAPAQLPSRVKWTMCVVVDGIALKRGYTLPGERCEVPGIGTVSVEWARQLMDDCLVDLLVHDTYDIRAYASSTRHRPRALQWGLLVRDWTCMVPGCKRQARLQVDHTHDFAKGGPTAFDNTDRFCNEHHDQKTHRGARYEVTDTERLWWPPPPLPGEPPPPEGTVPWRAPLGENLSRWNLTELPGTAPPRQPRGEQGEDDAQLPFT